MKNKYTNEFIEDLKKIQEKLKNVDTEDDELLEDFKANIEVFLESLYRNTAEHFFCYKELITQVWNIHHRIKKYKEIKKEIKNIIDFLNGRNKKDDNVKCI